MYAFFEFTNTHIVPALRLHDGSSVRTTDARRWAYIEEDEAQTFIGGPEVILRIVDGFINDRVRV